MLAELIPCGGRVLALAMVSKTDVLVTGDKDLLDVSDHVSGLTITDPSGLAENQETAVAAAMPVVYIHYCVFLGRTKSHREFQEARSVISWSIR